MAILETRSAGPSKARAHALALLGLALAACDIWRPPPDVRQALAPETLAPPARDRPWTPRDAETALAAPPEAWRTSERVLPSESDTYDLPALLDVALRDNPDTRAAWESARQAAAGYGRALAPFYPRVGVEVGMTPASRYQEPVKGDPLTIHMRAAEPSIALTYTLLDFGRRAQSAELARQRLVAANFAFNRRLQDVVFDVQRGYYRLDAAHGLERAAERNLQLARTVLAAAEERLDAGLATRPEALLARQVEARARYDLENAHVEVKNAEADLALALGLPANRPLRIETLAASRPTELDHAVDALIDAAIRQRPDLAARVADLRAAEASIAKAKADFLPRLGFRGRYGQQIWDYSAANRSGLRANEPAYETLFTFEWDLFSGFDRLNALREAEAAGERARAELAATELDAIAEVWRAYHDYRAAARKLDFAEALLAASQDAYDGTFKTYEAGLSDIVELLTAERDLANARYTLVLSRAELLISAARVAYAAGAGR
ncbi:MAG: TolC family protein [Candidatus Binatia bacterium]